VHRLSRQIFDAGLGVYSLGPSLVRFWQKERQIFIGDNRKQPGSKEKKCYRKRF